MAHNTFTTGRQRHADKARELLKSAALPEGERDVALKVIDRFVSIRHEGPGRTTAAAQAVKDEIMASDPYKSFPAAQRYAARTELDRGITAARKVLQEAFDQLSSRHVAAS